MGAPRRSLTGRLLTLAWCLVRWILKVEVLNAKGRKVEVELPLGCRPVKAGELTKAGDLFLQGGRHDLDGREPRWLDAMAGHKIESAAVVARPSRRAD